LAKCGAGIRAFHSDRKPAADHNQTRANRTLLKKERGRKPMPKVDVQEKPVNGKGLQGIEKLLNSDQTGEILGICPKVVERMAKRGEIPGFKVGRFWRFKLSALEKWIDTKLESTRQPCRT
jgi:excisionase family DNA binding protein